MRQHAGKDRSLGLGQGEMLGVKALDLPFPGKTRTQRHQGALKMGGGPGHTIPWAFLLYTVFPFTILRNHKPFKNMCGYTYVCVYLYSCFRLP